MSFLDAHLAGEAVAAFVDGELGCVAHARALAHLDGCAECNAAVRAQREVAGLLLDATSPTPGADLTSRLRAIPMTAELGVGDDFVLAVQGGDLVFGRRPPRIPPGDLAIASLPGAAFVGGRRTAPRVRGAHPASRPPRPVDRRRVASAGPGRRVRRVLAGAVAGLAFGVFAAMAPTVTAGAGSRDPLRDVDAPVTGQMTSVRLDQPGFDRGSFRSPVGAARGGGQRDRVSRGPNRPLLGPYREEATLRHETALIGPGTGMR